MTKPQVAILSISCTLILAFIVNITIGPMSQQPLPENIHVRLDYPDGSWLWVCNLEIDETWGNNSSIIVPVPTPATEYGFPSWSSEQYIVYPPGYEPAYLPTLHIESIGLFWNYEQPNDIPGLRVHKEYVLDGGTIVTEHYGVTIEWLNDNGYVLVAN